MENVERVAGVRISRLRDGTWYSLPVRMAYGAPVCPALALERILSGKTAYVQPEALVDLMGALEQQGVHVGKR